jgi:hemolysin activation/secretion protein
VRGFRETGITGDTGGYMRNELYYTLPVSMPAFIGTSKLYAALDAGYIKKDRTDGAEGGHISGAAIGLHTAGNAMFLDVSLEKSLSRPNGVQNEGTIGAFRLGARF